jgi:predicted aldo/keto reductase-like oxidoreductase
VRLVQYRSFGGLEWRPSALGFGTMRLPTIGDDPANIDENLATEMIHAAIEAGVNYIDSAWPYHMDQCEAFLGRCLRDGYREKVKLATKMPTWLVEKPADFDYYLDEQLKRLRTEQIEFYLLHALKASQWPRIRDVGALEWAERALRDGRIGHFGFSFHGDLSLFQEIVDAYDWTFCQIQYNYMDIDFQAGTEGLRYAASKGLGVVIMEPLRGGSLTQRAPEAVEKLWATASTKRSQADWGLQWVWNQPEVSLCLSGMSAMEHVEENVASAERSGVGTLSPEDLTLIDRVRDAYRTLSPVPCTDCKYCQPCPSGVAIPTVFAIYNSAMMYGNLPWNRRLYCVSTPTEKHASNCVECGKCESACPQQIEIIDWLKKAHAFLTEEASST